MLSGVVCYIIIPQAALTLSGPPLPPHPPAGTHEVQKGPNKIYHFIFSSDPPPFATILFTDMQRIDFTSSLSLLSVAPVSFVHLFILRSVSVILRSPVEEFWHSGIPALSLSLVPVILVES